MNFYRYRLFRSFNAPSRVIPIGQDVPMSHDRVAYLGDCALCDYYDRRANLITHVRRRK